MSADVVPIQSHASAVPSPGGRNNLIMPTTFGEVVHMAEFLCRSGMVPSAMRGKPADVAAVILKGAELGMPPMSAIGQISIIEGKPSCSPESMRALAARAGHRITFPVLTDTKVTARGVRGDSGETLEITWTLDTAKAAGLAAKQTWKNYPRAMLVARATSELVRYHFPELGIGYIPEELGANVDERGEVIDVPSQFAPAQPAIAAAPPSRSKQLIDTVKDLDDDRKTFAKSICADKGGKLTMRWLDENPETLDELETWVAIGAPLDPVPPAEPEVVTPEVVEDVPKVGALMNATTAGECEWCHDLVQDLNKHDCDQRPF